MRITIERFGCYHHAVSGRFLIDGQYVCDTLESDEHCLPLGEYVLGRDSKRCFPYFISSEPISLFPGKDEFGAEGMRAYIATGNGVHGWRKRCVILGECVHLGFLIHSQECYDLVVPRLRMQLVRHHTLEVSIRRADGFVDAG